MRAGKISQALAADHRNRLSGLIGLLTQWGCGHDNGVKLLRTSFARGVRVGVGVRVTVAVLLAVGVGVTVAVGDGVSVAVGGTGVWVGVGGMGVAPYEL